MVGGGKKLAAMAVAVSEAGRAVGDGSAVGAGRAVAGAGGLGVGELLGWLGGANVAVGGGVAVGSSDSNNGEVGSGGDWNILRAATPPGSMLARRTEAAINKGRLHAIRLGCRGDWDSLTMGLSPRPKSWAL
jgi:hypothetical protein